jgi:hypothetical protein
MTDNVEMALYNAALEGHGWAVKFYLEHQGKRRGYMDRTEVDKIVQEELNAIVTMLEESLAPEDFRKVAAVLARKLG